MSNDVLNISNARLKKLSYFLLSGHEADEAHYPLHDNAYRLWRKNWEETFRDLKSDATLRADDFVRQSVISALFDDKKAVGLLLHSYLNLELEAFREHTYLSTYPPAVIAELRASGITEVLSMEYLTLDAGWRKSIVGVPLSEVILGLGAKVLENSGFPSMIVVTRNDRRVNQILYGYGARCLAPNLTKHNVPVDLVSLDQGKTHPGQDPEVNHWINYFWARKVDLAGFQAFSRSLQERKSA